MNQRTENAAENADNDLIGVAFLARGGEGGLAAAQAFLDSYRHHPAAWPHRLYILAKNWEGKDTFEALCVLCKDLVPNAIILELPDDGYDWGAYFRAAMLMEEGYVCFLNTHSIILADGWLGFMAKAIRKEGVGLAGCTASYGTPRPSLKLTASLNKSIARDRGWIKGLLAWRSIFMAPPRAFKSFSCYPNPHLRSNAFMMPRRMFIEFCGLHPIPSDKWDAYKMESGRAGLTRYVQNSGKAVVVAAADNEIYRQDAWMESGTFRVPGQKNLLVSDNQTRTYDNAERPIRRFLELASWGRILTD